MDDLVYFGGALKALDDSGRVGGHLVLWGSPDQPDATRERDYFTPETKFWTPFPTVRPLIYHHGLDAKLGDRELGEVELKADDAGVWMEGQLKLRDDYERRIFQAVKDGKMGLSSGSAGHLVRRERQPNGTNLLKSWPLVEASITPTPGEPRTAAVALKSLMGDPDPPAPGESFVDSCYQTASELVQSAAAFAKVGPAKLAALKTLRDSLDDLLRRAEPPRVDPRAVEAARAKVNSLLTKLGSNP